MNKKILIVGGTFDKAEGKPSGLINKMFGEYNEVKLINGGNIFELKKLIEAEINNYEILLWFANISNEEEKFNDFKKMNPKIILVESKRNDNEKYSCKELIWHMLKNKANLMLEFSKQDNSNFRMRILDPLGNLWLESFDFDEIREALIKRSIFLQGIERQRTINKPEIEVEIPKDEKFFEIVRKNAETFSELINPAAEANKRFLGNASFRCENGFPSFRGKENNCVFVSRRNVNKEAVDENGFVPVELIFGGDIHVYSNSKPSVDTPIQLGLYEIYLNINYMLHSHVYIEGAPFTELNIPCGGLDEIYELMKTIKKHYKIGDKAYYINLIGHGSLIMSEDLTAFDNVKYISREFPEKMY